MPVMAKIMQPTLDDKHRFMLGGKNDKVKQLRCITVKFFPDNLQEVTYVVEDDNGNLNEMSTSEFQMYRNRLSRKVEEEEEVKSAKGFVMKLKKRTFLECPDDSVEIVRMVQGTEMPSPAEKMMSLTQEQMKTKGFNDEFTNLKHWLGMNEEIQKKMNLFQKKIYPSFEKSWTDMIIEKVAEFNEKERLSMEKKAKKLSPPPKETNPTSLVVVGEWANDLDQQTAEEENMFGIDESKAQGGDESPAAEPITDPPISVLKTGNNSQSPGTKTKLPFGNSFKMAFTRQPTPTGVGVAGTKSSSTGAPNPGTTST